MAGPGERTQKARFAALVSLSFLVLVLLAWEARKLNEVTLEIRLLPEHAFGEGGVLFVIRFQKMI
jgi:hypothetical protein